MRALGKTLLILSLAFFALPVFAQQDPPARVGRVSIVEGALAFYGPGDNDWSAAKMNFPVVENGWFATDPNSRTAFRIGTDSIFLANNTEAGFARLRDKDMQLALQQGRVALHLRQLNPGNSAEVDTARAGIWLLQSGDYDIDAGDVDRPTRIAVFDGSARLVGRGVDITIKAGDALILNGTDTLSATIERATVDEFVRWCRSHDYHEDRLAAPHHVSPAMTGFEELDSYGAWTRETDYGEVWFPRSVPADWAPYRDGHWVWIEPWGWNWVDDEPWGFAPCHYGRWTRIHDRWAWVPGEFVPEPVYAPALVAFIPPPAIEVAVPVDLGPPVGWFPLGPGEIYWPSYTRDPTYIRNVNITSVNVTVINKVTQVAAAERTATPPPVVLNQTFANRSAATVVPATVMTTAANVAPAAIRLSPQVLQKASISVRPPRVIAQPMPMAKPAANAGAAPGEAPVKAQPTGRTAPNTSSTISTAESAGRPLTRPNFSRLAPAPQLTRPTAGPATQTTMPPAAPYSAGTAEQRSGQATAPIPPTGTHSAGAPQQRPGEAPATVPPPGAHPTGEIRHHQAQTTTAPLAPGAHSVEQQPSQATTAPQAPGRPPGPPDFSHLASPRGAFSAQPSQAPAPGAPRPAPHEATASPPHTPGLARREQTTEPGVGRAASEMRPPPNRAAPSQPAANPSSAQQEIEQRRTQQEQILRKQAQQHAATEAAARAQAQQTQQRAAAEAAARAQAQQAQQRAAAEAAARAQAQQAQQRAAAEAAARAKAQQAAAQQHAAAAHACGRPGEPPCPK